MNKRTLLTAIGAVAIAAIVAFSLRTGGGGSPETDDELKTVRFGTGLMAVDYAPYYVAKKMGWYDEALKGHKTTHTIFQGPAPANEALAGNAVDVVLIAEPPVIVGKAAGIDQRIADISAILTQEILVPTQSNIKTVADLKGKKVAVVEGSSSHYGLAKALEKSGIAANEVQIINMFPPDAKAAFASGNVDAWAVWPPWVEVEELAGTGRVLPGQGHVINSLLVVRGKFADENRQLVAAIVEAHERAKKWMIANPEDAQKIVAEALNEPIAVVKKAWPRHKWDASLSEEVLTDLQNKADFLKERGMIKAAINVKETMLLGAAH